MDGGKTIRTKKKRRSGGLTTGATPQIFDVAPKLRTNPRAAELAVILNSDLATAEKVCYRCYRFFAVFRAGTDRENEIAKRELRARLKD